MSRRAIGLLFSAWFLLGCAPRASHLRTGGRPNGVRERPTSVDIAEVRRRGESQRFAWEPFSDETFARAKREGRFILLHGAASWCHWCHVMEEVTYADPEIGALLRDRFVAIRVDIDARPDIAERYGEWGWPATILMSPGATELGKHRGYLPPEELAPILRNVAHASALDHVPAHRDPTNFAPAPDALGWIGARVALDMDDYFDPREGGWGRRQKAPLGANIEFELRRAAHGDGAALERALVSAAKQRALIDPIWGGIYQYSAGSTWAEPHYEKLMAYQAENLEAYARAYEATGHADVLGDARRIEGYVSRFLSDALGAFLVSQDADVGAHDPRAPFIPGRVYYARDDAGRRALGLPRIDAHVYAHENGLAIAAYCSLFEATHDGDVLARAERAADLLLASHVLPEGGVLHEADRPKATRFLADAASFGRALARLAEVTGDVRYREAALRVAGSLSRDFGDAESGAFWERTNDESARGVFRTREHPFVQSVMVARFFAALARVTQDASWRARGLRALAAVATPRALAQRGRMVGAFLLAIDELGAFPWSAPNPVSHG